MPSVGAMMGPIRTAVASAPAPTIAPGTHRKSEASGQVPMPPSESAPMPGMVYAAPVMRPPITRTVQMRGARVHGCRKEGNKSSGGEKLQGIFHWYSPVVPFVQGY